MSLSLVKPPQQQQQKTRQTLDRMDGSASIDGEFVEVNVRRAAQTFECAAATGIGEGGGRWGRCPPRVSAWRG
eukprot:COSAG01_NODE_46669_length_398_cov_0.561873_1_plen_72_part_10